MPAPRKYPVELRERAVRLYMDADPKPVIRQLAGQLGVHPEALRGWIKAERARQETADAVPAARPGKRAAAGDGDRVPQAVQEELDALRRETIELRRANEILKAASAYFAVQLDQTGRRF